MRLNKFIANTGYCSRRKADELIAAKKILVNEMPAKIGMQVDPSIDTVRVKKGPKLFIKNQSQLVLLHKPKGYVCTKSDPYAQQTVYDLLDKRYHNFKCVGRLDKSTEGLLILSNDGDLVQRLAHPKYGKEKVYIATIKGELTASDLKLIRSGMRLKDYKIRGAQVEVIHYDVENNKSQVKVTLTEGKNRQIHNMFLALKKPVKYLKRIRFGNYRLGRLKLGAYKVVTAPEKL